MRHRVSWRFVTLLLAAGTGSARGQENGSTFLIGYGVLTVGAIHNLATRNTPPKVEVGSNVKLWLRGCDSWSNRQRIRQLRPDSIVVEGNAGGRSYARSEIDSLRVKASTGRWAEGWAVGLLAGGVVGAGLGLRISGNDEYLDTGSPAKNALVWGIVMGVSGSTIGAAIGLLVPSRYVTIRNEPGTDPRFSVLPTVGRPGLVARFEF